MLVSRTPRPRPYWYWRSNSRKRRLSRVHDEDLALRSTRARDSRRDSRRDSGAWDSGPEEDDSPPLKSEPRRESFATVSEAQRSGDLKHRRRLLRTRRQSSFLQWFCPLFAIQRTVLPKVWSEVLCSVAFSVIAVLMDDQITWEIDPLPWELLGIVLGFLIGFRNELSVSLFTKGEDCLHQMGPCLKKIARAARTLPPKPKAEINRMLKLLFGVACRDLQKGSLEEGQALTSHQNFWYSMQTHVTNREATLLKKSTGGHRISLVVDWVLLILEGCHLHGLITISEVTNVEGLLIQDFTSSYESARKISYSRMPFIYDHIFLVLLCGFCFSIPFVFASLRFGWFTPVMTVFVSFGFFGMNKIAKLMENPFGFDSNDIPVQHLAAHLYQELDVIMQQDAEEFSISHVAYDSVCAEILWRSALISTDREQQESDLTALANLSCISDMKHSGMHSNGRTIPTRLA